MSTNENDGRSDSRPSDDISSGRTKVFHAAEVGPRKRLGLWVLVPPLIVFLTYVALPSAMLWYLLSRPAISPAAEDMYLFKGAIIAVEGSAKSSTVSSSGQAQVSTLYGLAFATIISHIVSITVPLLMGLLAYRVAAKWLDSRSGSVGEKGSEPSGLTPLQYGIMLKIYGSSNLFTLIQSGRYLYRQRRVGILRSPVLSSFVALAFVLLLSHAVGFVDLWLHTVSGTVVYASVSPIVDLASMQYGTAVNTTICPYPGYMQIQYSYINPMESTPGALPPGQNCASYDNFWVQSLPPGPGWGDVLDPSVLSASVSASNNMSDFRTTIIVETDNMAVLVPPSVSSDGVYNFTASTYGMSMNCQVPKCQLYYPGAMGVDGGPLGCTDFYPAYNATLYNLTSFLYDPTNMTQQPSWSNGTGNNPFGFFVELPVDNIALGLQTSGTDARNSTNGEPGWYYGTWPGSVVYMTQCTVTSYHVLLSNFNNTYTVVNSSLTDFNTTSALSTGFLAWMASTYLLPQVQNAMGSETQSKNFSSELQTQLMLRSLALNTGILQGMPVNASTSSAARIASRYPIAPVATFVALLYAYGIVALIVIVWACFFTADSVVVRSEKGKNDTHSVLQMVQLRLTDPLAVVAERFAHDNDGDNGGGGDADQPSDSRSLSGGGKVMEGWRRTLQTDALDMFDPDDQASLSPQISGTTSGHVQFGLRRLYGKLNADDAEAEDRSTDGQSQEAR